MSIFYAGTAGAFAHEACVAFAPDHEPVGVESFAAAIAAVKAGDTELGMLPVHNSRAGPVEAAAELIRSSGLRTVSEHELPVRMHLLALPGVPLADLIAAVSHPMALKQCAASLAVLGLRGEPATNTAVAARDLQDRTKAVLASEAAAAAYGLAILRRDMHDDPDNCTRFAILAR